MYSYILLGSLKHSGGCAGKGIPIRDKSSTNEFPSPTYSEMWMYSLARVWKLFCILMKGCTNTYTGPRLQNDEIKEVFWRHKGTSWTGKQMSLLLDPKLPLTNEICLGNEQCREDHETLG